MKQPKYKATLYILLFLILSSMLVAMASCSTVKRIFNKQKMSVDSTHVTTKDSLAIHTTDSSTYKKVDSGSRKESKAEGERTITIEFEDGATISNDATANDYAIFRPAINGKVKLINIWEKGMVTNSEVVVKNSVDSNTKKTFDLKLKSDSSNVHLEKKVTTKDKEVRKSSTPFIITLIIILEVAIVLYLLWCNRQKSPLYQKLKTILLKIFTGI